MPAVTSASRSRLVGLAVGVLLLVAVVFLAVVLPRIDGASAESEDGGSGAPTVELPATLPGLVSVETSDPDQAADLRTRLDSAEQGLEDLYGVPVTIGLYGGEDGGDAQPGAEPAAQRSAVVTALAAPAGLFLPTGPAPEPGLVGLARNPNELVRVGDAVCSVAYGQPVPEGQEVDDSELPASVQCQVTSGEVTYQLDGSGLSLDEVVAALEALAGGA